MKAGQSPGAPGPPRLPDRGGQEQGRPRLRTRRRAAGTGCGRPGRCGGGAGPRAGRAWPGPARPVECRAGPGQRQQQPQRASVPGRHPHHLAVAGRLDPKRRRRVGRQRCSHEGEPHCSRGPGAGGRRSDRVGAGPGRLGRRQGRGRTRRLCSTPSASFPTQPSRRPSAAGLATRTSRLATVSRSASRCSRSSTQTTG